MLSSTPLMGLCRVKREHTLWEEKNCYQLYIIFYEIILWEILANVTWNVRNEIWFKKKS